MVTYQPVPNFYSTSSRRIHDTLVYICVFTPGRQFPNPGAAPNLPNDSFLVEIWAQGVLSQVSFATVLPAQLEVAKTPGHIVLHVEQPGLKGTIQINSTLIVSYSYV